MNNKNFEALIQQHHAIIYKMSRVYADSSDFDDLYQEIIIQIWRSFPRFSGESKESTWLYRVALNTALTYHRNESKRKEREANIDVVHPENTTANPQQKEQQIERLYAAISQLKKEDRWLIVLHLEGKTYDEMVEITGLSNSNIGVKLNRIKKKLMNLLTRNNNE